MEGNDILGIKIGLDFEAGESEAKLKSAIEELQATADGSKIDVDIKLNTTQAQEQLDKLKTDLEEAGSTFKTAFDGVGVKGLGEVLSALEKINVLTKEGAENLSKGFGNATSLDKMKERIDETKASMQGIGEEVESTRSKLTAVYDSTGKLVKTTEQYKTALGETATVVTNLANSSKNSTKITLDNLKQSEKAYKQLQEAMKQVEEQKQRISEAKNSGVDEKNIKLLEEQLEIYKNQEKEARNVIETRNLANSNLQKEMETKQQLTNLETQYNNEVNREAEKMATINKLLQQRFEIQQRLARDNYKSSDNKAMDIVERDALTRTINNRKKNLSLRNRADVDETLEGYNQRLQRIKNDTAVLNAQAIAKEEESLAQQQFNTVKALIKEEQSLRIANLDEENANIKEMNEARLLSIQAQKDKIGTELFNPEQINKLVALEEEGIRKFNLASEKTIEGTQQNLLNKFKNLLNEEKTLANEFNRSKSTERQSILKEQQDSNLAEQSALLEQMEKGTREIALNRKAMLETEMQSVLSEKEQVSLLGEYATNLKQINNLKRQEKSALEGGDYQLSLIEKENQLMERNASIYSKLDEYNQAEARSMQEDIEYTQRLAELKQNELQTQREQNELAKQYVASLKEEDSLNKQYKNATSDTLRASTEEKINSLLEQREELYSRMSSETRAYAESQLQTVQAQREAMAVEEEEKAQIEGQATLYKELLDLQIERANVEAKYTQTSSTETYKIQQLVNEYRELSSAIGEKNSLISQLGLEDEALARENQLLLQNSNA